MFCRTFGLVAVLCFVHAAHATESPALTLFENVRIFDGKTEALSASMNVLVRGNTIEKISKDPIPIDGNSSAKIIAGGGRTLMPGLIDAHWHTMLVRPTPTALLVDNVGYLNLLAGAEATDTLMRGFTTVRDMGGPSFGLKRAIDEGIVAGPRIYPSGAIITVTGGHGDFRQPYELPRVIGAPLARQEQTGAAMIADSPDEVRVRVREQLMPIALAKKYKLKTAFGTDILFSQRLAQRQGELLVKFTRWYTPAETLAMATGTNGELLAMSGERNPYPGKLGVIEQGALADLLLVDGDPIADIKLIEDPAKNLVVIMKDGKIYKNIL